MIPFRSVVLTLSLVTGSAGAQSTQEPLWLAPGLSRSEVDAFLDFTTNPQLIPLTSHPRPIFACSAHKMPSDPPGRWTLSFTIRALQGYGNPGFSGFFLAKWEPSSATPLVLTHEADAVNGAFVDYNLNLEPATTSSGGGRTGGRYAVFDRFGSPGAGLPYLGIHLASRADDTSAFGAPVPVANVQGTNGFGDPALGYVDGRLKLFYAGQARNSAGALVSGILMDDLLDVASGSPRAAGNPVLVTQPSHGGASGTYCHSPSLLHGADGDVEGLFVAEGDGPAGRSDIYLAADLDPDTAAALTVENTSWLSSGGPIGGMAIFTQRSNPQAPYMIEGAWVLGDEVAPGGVADITMSAYGAPGRCPAIALVHFGARWLRSPVQLPDTLGELGIRRAVCLRARRIADADQRTSWQVRIPPAPGLRGVDVPLQGLAVHVAADGSLIRTLTNTAAMRIR